MNIYLVMSLGGLLGISLHVLVTMQTINKNTPSATFKDVWNLYLKTDRISFIISIVSFAILLYLSGEYVNFNNLDKVDYSEPVPDRLLHYKVANFIKTSSVIAGYFSDYIIYKFIGKTKKALEKKLGDEADDKTP